MRRLAGRHENTRSDYRPDAERGQIDRPQRPLQPILSPFHLRQNRVERLAGQQLAAKRHSVLRR